MATPDWPTSLPDPRALRSAREELLSRGLRAGGPHPGAVRPVIDRSWRRCVADAVPTVRPDLAYTETSTMALALHDAAAPVLARMGEHLGALRVGLYVSNDKGQILLRHVHDAQYRQLLDRACAAEGFDFSEGSVGTNGMGTALVERRPVLIHGAEHFSDLLEDVTCAATPIFEPFTRRLLGTFSLACASRDASPLMYGLTTDVGRQIESNLTTMLGAREQALIRAYLMAEHESRDPVLVLTERTVFANTAGVPHLDSTSHALLWDHLTQWAPTRGSVRLRLPLAAGWCDAAVEAVDGTRDQQPAWCIRLTPTPALPAQPPGRGNAPGLPSPGAAPGQTARPVSSARCGPAGAVEVTDLAAALDVRRVLAIEGGAGAGKLYAARALLTGTQPVVVDLSGVGAADGWSWSGRCRDALATGRPVVLCHVQDLHTRDVNRVLALAAAAGSSPSGPPLVLTWDGSAAPEHVDRLVRRVAPAVRLPALAEDPQRVVPLAMSLLAELAPAEHRPHLSSDALQCLLRWTWPGNVEELRGVLLDLCEAPLGRPVRQADLPARLQRAPRRRAASLMESAEREAIVAALQQAGGNRSGAARLLGIGRTTLYRKLQQLRIDA